MPKILMLALYLFAFTLPVPLFVWAASTNWRKALEAWAWFGGWMGALYFIGFLTWLGMGAPT